MAPVGLSTAPGDNAGRGRGFGAPCCSRDLIAAGGLVALAVGFWLPWLARASVPVPVDQQTWMLPWAGAQLPVSRPAQWSAFWWDGVAQFYPWRLQLHRWLSCGEWPLWNPSQFCGYPFVGNGQSAMFYPPNWLYALVHPRLGFTLLATLHTALALLLTFALGRSLGLGRWASSMCGIAFALGGFMVGWTPLPTATNCLAWLPGCLLGVEAIVRGRGARGAMVLGLCGGMAVLAGHFQFSAYVLLATGLYAVARVLGVRNAGQSDASRMGAEVGARLVPAGWMVVGLMVALLIAAGQLLPSLELGSLSARGTAQADMAGFEDRRQWALQPQELITLVAPDALGNPGRGDYWGFAYGERCGYVGLAALVLGVVGLLLGPRRRWGLAVAAVVTLWAAMGGLPARLLYFGVPKVGLTGGFPRLLSLFTFCAAMLAGQGVENVWHRMRRALPGVRWLAAWIGPVMVTALLGDLCTWAWRTLPCGPAERLYPHTGVTRALQANWRAGDRMLAVTPRESWTLLTRPRAVFPPNSESAYEGLESVQGYDSLYPASFRQFATRVEGGRDPSPAANGNMMLLENTASPLLDLAGVRWIVSEQTEAMLDLPGHAMTLEGIVIRCNERAFPRAFLTDHPPAAGPEALDKLATQPVPLRQTVTHIPSGCNRLVVQLPALSRPRTLVITNTWYPGWRAWRDGQPVPVQLLGGVFQAVALEPGAAGKLLVGYIPASVQVGLFLLLCGAGTVAALWVFSGVGERFCGAG